MSKARLGGWNRLEENGLARQVVVVVVFVVLLIVIVVVECRETELPLLTRASNTVITLPRRQHHHPCVWLFLGCRRQQSLRCAAEGREEEAEGRPRGDGGATAAEHHFE